MRTFWWVLGGFVAYEVIAWKVNDSRIVAARKTSGGQPFSYNPMPFDLIGKYVGYPGAGLGPEVAAIPAVPAAVSAGLANPAAARAAVFNANTYPGVAPMPTVPQFSITDPLGINGGLIVN